MLISKIIDDMLNEILIGTYRAHVNTLDGALSDSDTEVVFNYPVSGLGTNSYIEVDQELMYVVPEGLNETAKTFTVIRGVRGTTATAHEDAAVCNINPRFPRATLLSAMQEEARSWPISIFCVNTAIVDAPTSGAGIQLVPEVVASGIIRVIQVWRESSTDRWISLTGWRYDRDSRTVGTGDLVLETPVSGQIRVLLARPITGMNDWIETSDTTDAGMVDSMCDMLKYGAAWRVVTGRETRRLFSEVESEGRVAADVPAQAILTLGRQLKMLRDARVGEEIQRLRSIYPIRST